jgi:hypothetical protein
MDAMESLARGVAKRFSESATRTTKPTTVLAARLVENFLPIAVCPGYCDRIGRARSKRLSLSSVARSELPTIRDNKPFPNHRLQVAICCPSRLRPGLNGLRVARRVFGARDIGNGETSTKVRQGRLWQLRIRAKPTLKFIQFPRIVALFQGHTQSAQMRGQGFR